jgi:hypothetical protein
VNLLEVGVDRVVIRFGPAFRAEVPRRLLTSVRVVRSSPWAGIGAHFWKGAWVVGSRFGEAVELTLSEPVRVRVLGVPLRGRRFQVVVDDPEAVVAALA